MKREERKQGPVLCDVELEDVIQKCCRDGNRAQAVVDPFEAKYCHGRGCDHGDSDDCQQGVVGDPQTHVKHGPERVDGDAAVEHEGGGPRGRGKGSAKGDELEHAEEGQLDGVLGRRRC